MPTLPHKPESLEALQSRYPRALEHLYDVKEMQAGGIRPGEVAANVFDFEDGLRLIVSRERMPEGQVVLHWSASFPTQCQMADEFRLLALTTPLETIQEMWLRDLPRRFAELSGDTRQSEYLGQSSPKLVPHFVIED